MEPRPGFEPGTSAYPEGLVLTRAALYLAELPGQLKIKIIFWVFIFFVG